MYNIGDKVLYPMYGAGIIDSVEERKVLGEKKLYYTMKMPVGDMKIMIPVDNAEATGLRYVVDEETANKALDSLKESTEADSESWNRRFRSNQDKLKSGNIFAVCEVVKNLSIRDKERGLSTGESKMLSEARQILISELVLSLGKPHEAVERTVEKNIFG